MAYLFTGLNANRQFHFAFDLITNCLINYTAFNTIIPASKAITAEYLSNQQVTHKQCRFSFKQLTSINQALLLQSAGNAFRVQNEI